MENILGIDVGGTNVKMYLKGSDKKVITQCIEVKNLTQQVLLKMINDFCQKNRKQVKKAGIAISGLIKDNTIIESFHRPSLVGLEKSKFQEIGIEKVDFINDGNAMAVYAARTYKSNNVVSIAAGTRHCLWNCK